jgi:ribosomal protein L40E
MPKNKKFCPRCGTQNNIRDAYCIKCGYSFRRKREKTSLKTILIVLLVIIGGWIALRIYLKQPIIPQEFIDLIKNMSSNKTG